MTKQLTKHFSEAEFLSSNYAKEYHINNIWQNPQHKINAIRLCEYLEYIRQKHNHNNALKIISGYRIPVLNQAIGGTYNSYHQYGLAADIQCHTAKLTKALWQSISLNAQDDHYLYDQIIYYQHTDMLPFLHIGLAHIDDIPRGHLLYSLAPGRYQNL